MTKIEITKFGIDWTMLRHVPHVCGGFSHGHFGAYSLSAVGSAAALFRTTYRRRINHDVEPMRGSGSASAFAKIGLQ
jgi:hypothetical protein